ncbi:MAG: heat-inducible transcriptional repressor HrcA [Eubacterium sp.]|nr:heat-inducible transcriptional repressor HrcA [Eubacterium sp.]
MELELDERKQKILDVIIRQYMESGEPVGSRTVSKYTDLNLSSATIRNEMADLEEMGYIIQPHTSAGRIPSDKAYRMYVDYLLKKDKDAKDEDKDKSKVKNEVMIEKSDQIEQLLQQVAKLLAQNTNYTTMVSQPRYRHKKIKFVQLNRMSDEQILVIVVLDNNQVKNKFVTINEDIDENVVAQMNFIINTALNGLDVTEISMAIMQEIKEKAGEYTELAGKILDCIAGALTSGEASKVYTSGATNILKYPELSDKEKMVDLLSTFEENQKLQAWVEDDDSEPQEHNIQVYIGDESPIDTMKDCSVVTATYKIREGVYGKIGIVGPKRMDYERVVETLESCMQQLDTIFKGDDKKAIEQKE